MVSRGRVSQWGPNPQGVRSRSDRSVSLRDVRDLPVQMMGLGQGGAPGKFGGGYGVHTRISELDGEYRVRLFIDGEYQAGADYFADDIEEATETAKAMEEDAHLSDKTSDVARGEVRDFVEDAIMRPDLDEVVVPEDLDANDARLPVEESRGLTADEAFQQHKAASGYSMMGKRPDSKQGYFPGFGGANESIEQDIVESKENVRPRTPEEQAAWEREQKVRNSPRLPVRPPPPLPPPVSQMAGPDYAEGEYATSNWWDSVPGLDDLPDSGFDEEGVADFDPWDPELRSMDSQMLADMVAARAAQPDEGYFGGMGEAVQGLTARVAEMSGTERAALISALVAAGLLTVGSAGVLAPAGAALLGGAGMAAMNP